MMLAALPLVLSAQIGIAHTQVPTIGGAHETCMGYWDRTNWVSLIVLLPVALWTARKSALVAASGDGNVCCCAFCAKDDPVQPAIKIASPTVAVAMNWNP